ncbi:hypothetical protein ACSVUS_000598 [Vibrio alginolyticus]|uniref:hypothetical protein n=1 Tax=Vibrio alginolyticus TaxID=663 RepID=UPI00193D5025|nr:hypothetical protein [Vibrio alginolyticus]MBM5070763.1 hypothetical protein [Vibrio parahaemolyticus]EJA7359023.1 hypothetical protein [Vibrio alginolyticus]ELB2834195.1 hypothetical protein [Vibrio alginolyticus]MBT0045513.1 hypothetical protein [Vibrio alginolyticus]MCR9598449.1 hypothetical protein [Vibrio alginolyticus]
MGRTGTKRKMKHIRSYLSTELPEVRDNELFANYKTRLPHRLKNIPDDVLEQWPFEVEVVRKALNQRKDFVHWTYRLVELTSNEILTIRHYPYDESRLFPKAHEWLSPKGVPLRPIWFDRMLEQGTFIRPIILAHNANNQVHPILSFEYPALDAMFTPYHLLEGNRRLSLLRAMIELKMEGVKERHSVWLVDMG